MTDSDYTNDIENINNDVVETETESIPVSEETLTVENVMVEDVYQPVESSDVSEVVAGADTIVESSEEFPAEEVDVPAVAEKETETESVAEENSEENKHSVDLAGYRAYRKRNINKKADSKVSNDTPKVYDEKIKDKLLGNVAVYYIGLAVITLFDFFAMHLFTTKQSYFLSDMILSALGFDVLQFTNITYEQICIGLGYFVAFIAGGVVLLVLLKILNKLFSNFSMSKIGNLGPIIALGIFAAIFAVGFIITYVSKDSLVEMGVYRWGAPAMAYLGGLIFYGASKLHVGIEY